MATLYLETSAVLAWLLDEPEGQRVQGTIAGATGLTASALTELEVGRVISRDAVVGKRSEADTLKLQGALARERRRWTVVGVIEEVLERAARKFPVEPVRTLDAIHLATALELLTVYPDLELLTLDARIAQNAHALGLPLAS